jgi:pimeloyl-ACP methyl ester carboxylesterase
MRARWCLLAALAVALAACGGGTGGEVDRGPGGTDVAIDVPATPGSNQVIRLAGIERGNGSVGVVLAHMLGSNQQAWTAYAATLADDGFHVLTFDFRGHGASGGDRNPSLASLDLAAAVAKIRQLGASRVLVVGASMGGTAALVVASTEQLAGVVTISAPMRIDELDAGSAVRNLSEPALFIVGEKDDKRYVDAARAFNAAARQPKRLAIIAGTGDHGTDLLTDPRTKSRVQRQITDFLVDNRG